QLGNTVLSGHRDTQFRFLKDLVLGDRIRLETANGTQHDYVVTGTLVIDAQDVEILSDTDEARLTLVTCFPFDALVPGGPLRYVVQADRVPSDGVRDPAHHVAIDPKDSVGPSGRWKPETARLRELHVARARQELIALAGDHVGAADQDTDALTLIQQARVQHEGRSDLEDVGRGARDLERLEPTRRVADADPVSEAHLEGVAEPRTANDLQRRSLDLSGRYPRSQLPETGAQAAQGDVVELAGRRFRLGAGDDQRLHRDAVVATLHATNLDVHEI